MLDPVVFPNTGNIIAVKKNNMIMTIPFQLKN